MFAKVVVCSVTQKKAAFIKKKEKKKIFDSFGIGNFPQNFSDENFSQKEK